MKKRAESELALLIKRLTYVSERMDYVGCTFIGMDAPLDVLVPFAFAAAEVRGVIRQLRRHAKALMIS